MAAPKKYTARYVGDGGASVTVLAYTEEGTVDFTFPHGETVTVPKHVADSLRESPNFEVS